MDVKYILPILDILLARLEENPRVEHVLFWFILRVESIYINGFNPFSTITVSI